MSEGRSKALDDLAKLSQEYEESENAYHEEMDSWWNNLSKEDQWNSTDRSNVSYKPEPLFQRNKMPQVWNGKM